VALGVAPSLFHMQLLPFYLDEVTFDKEVTSWPRVTVEKKKMGVSYVMPTIAQRSAPMRSLLMSGLVSQENKDTIHLRGEG
jgi:hypothetical protein